MVSLFTQFVTGYATQVPVIDERLISHVDVPAVASQEERPAAQEEQPAGSTTPDAQSGQ